MSAMQTTKPKTRRKLKRLGRASMNKVNRASELPQAANADVLMKAFDNSITSGMQFVEQMVLPEDSEPLRMPDNVTSASAVFRAPYVKTLGYSAPWDPTAIDADFGGYDIKYDGEADGSSVALAFPGTRDNLWTSNGTAATLLGAGSSGVFEPHHISSTPVIVGDSVYVDHSLLLRGNGTSTGIIPRRSSAGFPTYFLGMSTGTTLNIRGSFRWLDGSVPATAVIYFNLLRDDGASETVSVSVTSGLFSINTAYTAYDAFQIAISNVAGPVPSSVPVVTLYKIVADDTHFFTLSYNPCCYTVDDTPDLTGLDSTSSERTTALSALVTYMGAELSNGGAIAWARLPPDYPVQKAPNGDIYGFLARQPFYADDYPLKNGAYSFWVPETIDEYSYIQYGSARCKALLDCSCLAFAMTRDTPSQDVRYKVFQHIEVLTRSVTYSSAVAPVNIMFPEVLRVIKDLPAGSMNEVHVSLFRRLLQSAKRAASKPSNWAKLFTGIGRLILSI